MARDDSSALVRKLHALEQRLKRLERGQRIAHGASIEDAAVEVRDGDGSLRAIVGQQGDGTTAVNVVNGPTPPTPSAPTVESALAALAVTWDGTFADAQAAPLDWLRCEVHIGPAADFSPDQTTLRDTIESPQGGTVVVSLPYTQWHVKLRSRTTSGVTSAPTAAVAGTPRKADTPDIVAGAITADLIDVDALNGRTITGSTIRTSASGQRVVLAPQAPDPSPGASQTDTVAAVEVHSGAAAQVTPGALIADVDNTAQAYPYTGLHSPSLKRDGSYGFPITSWLQLLGPQLGVRGGAFRLEANTALTGTDQRIGNAFLYGYTGSSRTGSSHLELYCMSGDQAPGGTGTGLGARSWVQQDGAQVRLRAADTTGDASLYVTPAGVQAGGMFTAGNMAWGTVPITPTAANTPTGVTVSYPALTGATFHCVVTAQTTVPGTSMKGVSATNPTSTSVRVWLTRDNTTTTTVSWVVVGS